MSVPALTFDEIVEPLRAEFALDPVTGRLTGRPAGLLARLVGGLAVLGCVQGGALLTPAAAMGAPTALDGALRPS